LRVDGRAVSQVGANQAVPVVFHYGPVSVSMAFPCSVGVVEEFDSVAVTVVPPPQATGTATPGPGAGQAGTGNRQQSAPRPHGAAGPTTAPAQPPVTDFWAPGATPSASAVPGTGPQSGDNPVAVDVPVPASGTPVNGPSGLLAMVATVLSIGVGMAAIRAIMARRTIPASLA
jgi:hypothetical protein